MGSFLSILMAVRYFSKPPLTIEEQVKLLNDRGMVIADKEHARSFLEHCLYYRFCGYALHFELFQEDGIRLHLYREGTSFESVENIYHFDGALRRLLFHYLTIIEVYFRTLFANETSEQYHNPHWYVSEAYFTDFQRYKDFINNCEKEFRRSSEIFIEAYRRNYDEPMLPPVWMMAEIASFATLSKCYENLNDKKMQEKIAQKIGVSAVYLISWLNAVTVLRNICAHHGRIWNRNFRQAPKMTKYMKTKIIDNCHKKLASLLMVIHVLLLPLGRADEFEKELSSLLTDFSSIDLKYMGIPGDFHSLFARKT